MNFLREKLAPHPDLARVVPFALLFVPIFFRDAFGEENRYWLYLVEMVIGLWAVIQVRPLVLEARWAFSWEAVVLGVLMCAVWVGLDPYYPKNTLLAAAGKPWNPFGEFGDGSGMGWFFWCVRAFGSALIVPPIEEAFYRSWMYRYLVKINFTEMPLSRFHWLSFVVTSLMFGLAHYEWIPAIICGLSWQWLTIRKNRLGDAMTSHAITNFLLAIWIYWKNAWQFW